MNIKKSVTIIFSIFFFVCSYLYYGYLEKKETKKFCENTGGKMVSGVCVCGSIFPIYDKDLQGCVDRFGQLAPSNSVFEIIKKERVVGSRCTSAGWVPYVSPVSPHITVCYSTEWGRPKIVTNENQIEGLGIDYKYAIEFVKESYNTPSAVRVYLYENLELDFTEVPGINPLVTSFDYSVVDELWKVQKYVKSSGKNIRFSVHTSINPFKEYSVVASYNTDFSESDFMHFATTIWEDTPISL